MTTATQQEFAGLIGKHKSYVTRLKAAGRLVMTAEGLVNVEKSQALIAETADPSRFDGSKTHLTQESQPQVLPEAENAPNSFQSAKAMREKFYALSAKLAYEQASGKLIEADAARLFAADLSATFRAALEILPDRLAPELVPMSDTEAVRALLVETFEQVLTDLADKIAKWGNAPS